jgi:peptidoglycan L-alanyl-D-glutamate endopeptidase CwlK
MRNPLRLTFWICLVLTSVSSYAQVNSLFAPYDCRLHADLFEEVPAKELVAVDSALLAPIFEEPVVVVIDTVDGWQDWVFVENYAFGKDRGAMPMIADIDALHPIFRDKIRTLVANCREQGITLAVVESYRTIAKQNEYKGMGRKYTNSKGGRSKHQYGLAIDLVPMVDSQAVWDSVALWKKVGVTGEKLGLRWGGRWRKPYDPGHFEWTGGISTANLTQGHNPTIDSEEDLYPCLDEDIKLLQKYWNAWETAQSSLTRK